MRNLEKRLVKLEERRAAEVAECQKLLARLQAGRERERKWRQEQGLPLDHDPDWGLPPKRVIAARGSLRTIEILNQGRDRARLRAWRDKAIAETGRLPEKWD
jgi:hypothetical protein